MKALVIARRDLAAYFNGWWGWVVITAILILDGLFFNVLAMVDDARMSHEILEQFFYNTGGCHIVAALLLTMTSFSQEQHSGGENLLATSPITDGQIVLGKWLAAFGMLTIVTLLTVYMPALIFVNGKVAISHIVTGYVGMLAMGGAAAAIGIFFSALVRVPYLGPIISLVLAAGTILTLILLWWLSDFTDPPFTGVIEGLAFFENYMPFVEGRLRSDKLVFYGSFVFGFLFVTTRLLEGRRWR